MSRRNSGYFVSHPVIIMRAICANPASPLGENDFFRNQTGKLGL